MRLNIASLNIHDDKVTYRGGIDGKIDRVNIVGNLIESENYHYVGTQEITKKFEKRLKERLKKYKLYGKYRMSNTNLINIPWNESNKIITNQEIFSTKTHRLPWLPNKISDYRFDNLASIIPRICTVVINRKKGICMINTHLDYKTPNLQKIQLKKLAEIVTNYSKDYKIILTGDFNMEPNDINFSSFVNKLSKLGINKVVINDYTFKDLKTHKQLILDYIFIPKEWKIVERGIVTDKDYRSITDHTGVYVKVRTR
jgi:endonuclease/exonuclease/phosphatase family metal-dependent hydrolase